MSRIDVKNIDYIWHAFMPNGTVLRSAGVSDIVEQVEDNWPPLERGYELEWEARGSKFVVREIETKNKKMSKSREEQP